MEVSHRPPATLSDFLVAGAAARARRSIMTPLAVVKGLRARRSASRPVLVIMGGPMPVRAQPSPQDLAAQLAAASEKLFPAPPRPEPKDEKFSKSLDERIRLARANKQRPKSS